MTNTELLKRIINESGLKISFIADKVGIPRQTLWKKINNKSSFNQNEIAAMCDVLKITKLKDKEAIFFANV